VVFAWSTFCIGFITPHYSGVMFNNITLKHDPMSVLGQNTIKLPSWYKRVPKLLPWVNTILKYNSKFAYTNQFMIRSFI
jgi:hypothetical protein